MIDIYQCKGKICFVSFILFTTQKRYHNCANVCINVLKYYNKNGDNVRNFSLPLQCLKLKTNER